MSTSVVYVASPDWEINVFTSIYTLFKSGSSFDHIRVYSVGGKMEKLEGIDKNVEVVCVENKFEKDFYMNKTYIERENSERVIYIDSDTVVLDKIDKIYNKKEKSFIAKKVHNYEDKAFNIESWKKVLKRNEANYGPYFNAGFVIFQNKSHRKICKNWKKIYKKEKNNYDEVSKEVSSDRTIEQMSLSISVLKEGNVFGEMDKEHHVYGWEKKPNEVGRDAVVYHTGSRGGRHLKYASAVASRHDISFNSPLLSNATNPLFLKLQGYDLAYRTKHFFTGVGD